jgi:hypothetical protein
VQLTVCPEGAGQVQFVPDADVGVNPVGRVSLIVTVPTVAPYALTLLTTML